MPKYIEDATTKILHNFIWGEQKQPWIAMDTLHHPTEEGGLHLINIKARNEAIELMWLKAYLNLTPSRPTWALITDIVISITAPKCLKPGMQSNCFLQNWKPPATASVQ